MDNSDSHVEVELRKARALLLDFSLNNRFLNFKRTKRRTISIIDTPIIRTYSELVLEEKDLSFEPTLQEEPACPDHQSSIDFPANVQTVPTVDAEDGPEEVSPVSFRLRTPYESSKLLSKLAYVHKQANIILDEQGFNGFFLALCFLRWRESPGSNQFPEAPLILVPVEIKRHGLGKYQLSWTKEDVRGIQVLKKKLEEQEICIPAFEMKDNPECLEEYLEAIRNIAAEYDGWEVRDEVFVDFFNFTKVVMHWDLDITKWPQDCKPTDHPILRSLLGGSGSLSQESTFKPGDIDKKVDFSARHYVLDADPSQIKAIEDIRDGRSMVVHGPPGTGKSQTIVNLIAELLAQGRKVLFVSEKMAALQVVKDRLDKVGIGDFCLELHGRKTSKKAFQAALRKTLDLPKPVAGSPDYPHDEHRKLREHLNQYARSIRKECCPLGSPPFKLMSTYFQATEHFNERGREFRSVQMTEAMSLTKDECNSALSRLVALVESCPKSPRQSPWYGCSPVKDDLFFRQEIQQVIERCKAIMTELRNALKTWDEMGVIIPESIGEMEETGNLVEKLLLQSKFHPSQGTLSRPPNGKTIPTMLAALFVSCRSFTGIKRSFHSS
ncbi:DUF4011 domain-containing protein [Thermodesulfobacteriota bacterium]